MMGGQVSGPEASQLAFGQLHSCGIVAGKAYCWGSNTYGQLGNNSTVSSDVPVAVDASGVLSGKTVTMVSSGEGTDHTCVLADGKVYCWGVNYYGELGDGTTANSHVPVAVDDSGSLSGKVITKISVDQNFSCVVADGSAYCWGQNNGGALGTGSSTNPKLTPVPVSTSGVLAGKTVTDIDTRYGGACVAADGAAYCWGLNNYGQVGDNASAIRYSPVAVNASGVLSGKTVTAISAGNYSTCAVASGAAYCWGMGNSGQMGNGLNVMYNRVPIAVDMSGVLNGKTITWLVTSARTCTVVDGNAYCWGAGPLGDGTSTSSSVPKLTTIH